MLNTRWGKQKTYHSLQDFSENNVSSIQPRGFDRGDEELTAVRVGSWKVIKKQS